MAEIYLEGDKCQVGGRVVFFVLSLLKDTILICVVPKLSLFNAKLQKT